MRMQSLQGGQSESVSWPTWQGRTDDSHIRELGIDRSPTDALHLRVPVVLCAGCFVEKPVIPEILEQIFVV